MLPITLTLTLGASSTNYPLQITSASGFSTTTLTGLPNGTYSWRAKGPMFLSNSGTVVIGSAVTNLEMGLMRTGDLNGDNAVNSSDFGLLRANFGAGGTGPEGP